MDNNHQKFDSQSIANRVRSCFYITGLENVSMPELSRILDLSFSHAHRKLKGQSPRTLEQINSVAAALRRNAGGDRRFERRTRDARAKHGARCHLCRGGGGDTCVRHRRRACCRAAGGVCGAARGRAWHIYRADEPAGPRYGVDLIEIRPASATTSG
ncbi:hypothetical protein J4732_06725 [Serratia marcescens]|uniref:Transcription regulator BetR N-terminal domain-containing protein n=1 Tax=Serratia marcescens TaxID=615 RepID=A0A939NJN7_SERMA|nr:hypothetical protein [Serratia marcescens]